MKGTGCRYFSILLVLERPSLTERPEAGSASVSVWCPRGAGRPYPGLGRLGGWGEAVGMGRGGAAGRIVTAGAIAIGSRGSLALPLELAAGGPGARKLQVGRRVSNRTLGLSARPLDAFPSSKPSFTSILHFKDGETEAQRIEPGLAHEAPGADVPSGCSWVSQHRGGALPGARLALEGRSWRRTAGTARLGRGEHLSQAVRRAGQGARDPTQHQSRGRAGAARADDVGARRP